MNSLGCIYLFLFAVFCVNFFWTNPSIQGDTEALVDNSRILLGCLQNHSFTTCPKIIHFPVFQYIPSVILLDWWSASLRVLNALARFNTISTLLLLATGYRFLKMRIGKSGGLLYLLVLCTSFQLWYFNTTFNEPFGGLASLLLVISGCSGSLTIALYALLTCLTKETAWPFVLGFGSIAILFGKNNQTNPILQRRLFSALFVGTLIGILINCGFNSLRFGTFSNSFLMQDYLRTPKSDFFNFFAGLLFSPNGGLLLFAPLFFILSVIGISRWSSATSNRFKFFVYLQFVLLLAGFSMWFAPFGWIAWGPRLFLPWMPAILVLLLCFDYEKIKNIFAPQRFSQPIQVLYLLVGAWIGLLGLTHFLALFEHSTLAWLFSPTEACSRTAFVTEPNYYYSCMNRLIWAKDRNLLSRTLIDNGRQFTLWGVGYGVAFAILWRKFYLSAVNKD